MVDTVALVGNGASLVYSRDLELGRLATALRQDFEEFANGLDAALLRLARALANDWDRADPRGNFEALLGPVDRLGFALGAVMGIEEFDVDDETRVALNRVQQWTRSLYETGLGLTLSRVLTASRIEHNDEFTAHSEFAKWLTKLLEGEDTLRIFTLNYDVLLDAQFLDLSNRQQLRVSDQADGREIRQIKLLPDEPRLSALPLRGPGEGEWLTDGRNNVVIYHLHGSLQWVQSTLTGRIYKVRTIDDLRTQDYFRRFSQGESDFTPVVVLTDRKIDETLRAPFIEGYTQLGTALASADRVVIAGYGCGDEPVNAVIKRNLAARLDKLPEIAVITFAAQDAEAEHARVLDALASNDTVREGVAAALTVEPTGLPQAVVEGELVGWPANQHENAAPNA